MTPRSGIYCPALRDQFGERCGCMTLPRLIVFSCLVPLQHTQSHLIGGVMFCPNYCFWFDGCFFVFFLICSKNNAESWQVCSHKVDASCTVLVATFFAFWDDVVNALDR